MESESTNFSILDAEVYLSSILAPNAPVFTLFTPMAFLSLLRSVRCCFKNPINGSGGNPINGSGGNPIRKRKGLGGDRAENEGDKEISELDFRVLFSVLEKLELVLGLIHLDRFPDSLKSLVQTVAEIPKMALDFCGNSGSYDKLCNLCSQILCEVLKPKHGNVKITAAEVLKSLLPSVLLFKSQAHAFGIGFVINKMMGMAKDSDEVKKAVINFPKYMVHKAPDKSEPRAAAVESIIEIVRAMEYTDQVDFADYVIKMAQGAPHFRLLAVDLFLAMMMSLVDPFGVDSEGGDENSWGLRCLEALINRCSDSTAGTRARALTNLAQLVDYYSKSDRTRVIFKQVMAFDTKEDFRQVRSVNKLLRERFIDEKAAVRKAALLLASKLTGLVDGTFDEEVLKTMGMSCSDSLVSIRKAAVSSLSEIFRKFWDDDVTREWLHSVPRLITDSESSIQEECENLFLELVLDRVSRAGTANSPHRCTFHDSDSKMKDLEREGVMLFPEGVLCLLGEIGNREVTPWVTKICTNLGKKKRLKPKIAFALQSIIRTSETLWLNHSMPIEKWTAPAGAWLLLSKVSEFLPKSVDWEFLHHHWQLLDKHEQGDESKWLFEQELDEGEDDIEFNSVAWAGDRVFLLQTISNVSVELPPEAAADLADNLLKRVEEFNMHPTEVNAHLKVLKTLCKLKAQDAEETDFLVRKWVYLLLSKASEILETYMSNDLEANEDSQFITPPTQSKRATALMSRLLSQTISAVYTIGSLVIIYPSVELNHVVQILHKIITSGSSDPKVNKSPGPTVSVKQAAPALYIQAWVAMGKICLADEKLAKRYIPLFVEELDKSDSAALRNNIVVVMTDFCVQYTALVDSYISKITKCLRDPCEVVRRQTFILLTRLLQRDYMKWRGVIFLRFLLTLVDESEKIRHLADFLFGNILKAKAPLLAYNSFVEAIFVLNDCNSHTGHTSLSSRSESKLFSISGNDEKSRSQRMHIYTSLLKEMAPKHLLATFAKVCAEILASASDGMVNIEDAAGLSVLQDAFQILSCKEIKLPSSRGVSSDSAEMDGEGGDSGGATGSSARGKVVTQSVKRNLIQKTIPIFIELKRLLESKNSPLIGSLMECLRSILKDYKTEIDDMLVADKQLQKELTYDLQKYETVKDISTAGDAVATMQQSDTLLSPGDPEVTGSSMR